MKKLLKLFFVVSIILIPTFAKAQIFDPEYIISDDDLTNYNSMDKNDIQQFLDSKGILGTMTFVDIFGTSGTAAEIIYNASREFKINPKYILTTLQKEQSLVEGANIEQDDLDWATGFGICDSCSKSDPALQIYKGFANQVYHTARRNREYIDNPNKFSIKVNKTVKIDNVVITPKNQATVNLYLYTPHIQGNMSFFNIWNKYFSKNYPTGTLLQIKGQKEIWLIEGFYRRQVISLSAVASKYNIKNIIYTTKPDLEKYDIGIPVKFANYSLLRDENKNIYMLIDDVIKRISSWNVIKKLGLAQDEIINVKNAELEDYQRGETRQKLESKKNNIVNLQLLEYRQNRTDKSDVSLYEWVVEMKNKVPFDPYENENNPELYKMDSIERFEDFHSKRRQLVIDYLCECFGIN